MKEIWKAFVNDSAVNQNKIRPGDLKFMETVFEQSESISKK